MIVYRIDGDLHLPNVPVLGGSEQITLCGFGNVDCEAVEGDVDCEDCLAIVRYCKGIRLPRPRPAARPSPALGQVWTSHQGKTDVRVVEVSPGRVTVEVVAWRGSSRGEIGKRFRLSENMKGYRLTRA